jgi:hypothetical protein
LSLDSRRCRLRRPTLRAKNVATRRGALLQRDGIRAPDCLGKFKVESACVLVAHGIVYPIARILLHLCCAHLQCPSTFLSVSFSHELGSHLEALATGEYGRHFYLAVGLKILKLNRAVPTCRSHPLAVNAPGCDLNFGPAGRRASIVGVLTLLHPTRHVGTLVLPCLVPGAFQARPAQSRPRDRAR